MAFSYLEKKVFKQGCQVIAGVDEAGRGPLAGPVVAAVVVLKRGGLKKGALFSLPLKDSKQLSFKKREEIFEMINMEPGIEWRVSSVWPRVIDRINIWQATLLAWRRCLKKLNQQPDFLFLDGHLAIPRLAIKQQPVVKGDQKIFILSLASIIAKVRRDRLMQRLGKKYPEYEFSQHKGYCTKLHLARLKKFGLCPIHRKSFRPVRGLLKKRKRKIIKIRRI